MGICQSIKSSNRQGIVSDNPRAELQKEHLKNVLSLVGEMTKENIADDGNPRIVLGTALGTVCMTGPTMMRLSDEESTPRQNNLAKLHSALEDYGNELGCTAPMTLVECVKDGMAMLEAQIRGLTQAASIKLAAQHELYADIDDIKKLPATVRTGNMTLEAASARLNKYDELFREHQLPKGKTEGERGAYRAELLRKMVSEKLPLDKAVSAMRIWSGVEPPPDAQLV